jgi:predicted Zn-dependent protease with MMP-like domain
VSSPATPPLRRRRDRRGRGLRSELLAAGTGDRSLDQRWGLRPSLPAGLTRAERFDELVLEAVDLLERRWHDELTAVELVVEEVPPVPLHPSAGEEVPLSRVERAERGGGGRIVIYRRPLLARARDRDDLAEVVLDVVIHQLAEVLGKDVAEIDPEGHG